MSEPLVVAVNADGPRTLRAPSSFEAEGGFVIALTNEGDPTHVHLSLDGDLADAVAFPADNHFVERDATERVRVEVPDGVDATGRLQVATGYGATTRTVDLTVSAPRPVQVDESLADPPAAGSHPAGPTFDRGTVAGAAAAVVVLVAATALGAGVGGPAFALAGLLVAATAIGAAYAAYRFAGGV